MAVTLQKYCKVKKEQSKQREIQDACETCGKIVPAKDIYALASQQTLQSLRLEKQTRLLFLKILQSRQDIWLYLENNEEVKLKEYNNNNKQVESLFSSLKQCFGQTNEDRWRVQETSILLVVFNSGYTSK